MKNKSFKLNLLAAGVLLAISGQGFADGYSFTDLGVGNLPTSQYQTADSYATGINNAGQVTGSAGYNINYNFNNSNPWGNFGGVSGNTNSGAGGGYAGYMGGNISSEAVTWSGGNVSSLGVLTNGNGYNVAYGTNNSGQVAGSVDTSSVVVGGAGPGAQAITWNGLTGTQLESPGSNGVAYGINNSGEVAGNTVYYSPDYSQTVATTWNGGIATQLSLIGGDYSSAYGINNSGIVVGTSNIAADDAVTHAAKWVGSTVVDLGTLGGSSSLAYAINNSNQIVGDSYATGDAAFYATIWNGTTATSLGTLGGTNSNAYAINNSGVVVGDSLIAGDTATHATVWISGLATDLNNYLNATTLAQGWILTQATGVNDTGSIVGNAYNTITGSTQAFLLAPITSVVSSSVPEPTAYALLLTGLGFMFAARRRKVSQSM